ncbi:hypothetical protein Tco_0053031 [Tanacetum coccineum]
MDNIYSVDLKSVVPTGGLTCLIAKATIDESNTWFDGKPDEGNFVGYSVVSKAMRVFNKRTRIVEETLNIRFLENYLTVESNGTEDWLFDVDSLTISMNYVSVVVENQTNGIAGTKDNIVASQAQKEKDPEQEYILIPLCTTDPLISQGHKDSEGDARMKPTEVDERGASDKNEKDAQDTRSEYERLNQREIQTEHTSSILGLVLKLKGSKQSHIKVHFKGIIAKFNIKGSNIKGIIANIGSAEDERLVKKTNEKGIDSSKNEMVKEESEEEESTRKRKLGTEAPDEDKEVDYEILDKKYPIIEWKTKYLGTKPRVGVHTLMTEAGLVILMLIEKKYPLRKKVLLQMLELKLESEEDSTMALELIRFVKKLVAELEPKDSNEDEEDL